MITLKVGIANTVVFPKIFPTFSAVRKSRNS